MRNLLSLFKTRHAPTTAVAQTLDIGFTSIISEHTQSAGHMLIRNSIRIDGKHIGKIVKDPESTELITVIVSKTGRVEGLINADILIIEGCVRGTTRSTVGLYVTGSLEGIAFYGDKVEVRGEPSARLIRMNDRQKSLSPMAPSFDADKLLNGCNFMPNADADELKIQFEDVETQNSQNGDVIDILFSKEKVAQNSELPLPERDLLDRHENKSENGRDTNSSSKVTPFRVIATGIDMQKKSIPEVQVLPADMIEDDVPNLVSQYYS